MSPRRVPTNVAASVLARLRDVARQRRTELQLVLSEFAIERLLYRLGTSVYAPQFVLKGATLFKLWSDVRGRATWDLDLLGHGASDVASVVAVLRTVCAAPGDDGIVFEVDAIAGEEIRVPDEYAGVRVRLDARLGAARIPVQVDVGFGDAVVPAPVPVVYPTLLAHAAPTILAYPHEAVVAEKLEAVVSLGITNSRMKDFYDLHQLATTHSFDGQTLVRSVRATFERRNTGWPSGEPVALSPGFLSAPDRETQWRAFVRRGRLESPSDVVTIITSLRYFLLPLLSAASEGLAFDSHWSPGGPWQPRAGSALDR